MPSSVWSSSSRGWGSRNRLRIQTKLLCICMQVRLLGTKGNWVNNLLLLLRLHRPAETINLTRMYLAGFPSGIFHTCTLLTLSLGKRKIIKVTKNSLEQNTTMLGINCYSRESRNRNLISWKEKDTTRNKAHHIFVSSSKEKKNKKKRINNNSATVHNVLWFIYYERWVGYHFFYI